MVFAQQYLSINGFRHETTDLRMNRNFMRLQAILSCWTDHFVRKEIVEYIPASKIVHLLFKKVQALNMFCALQDDNTSQAI